MHIAVHGDVDAGMTQNLAQRLYVKSEANAVCGERMSEAMEIHGRKAAFAENTLEAVLHCSGFHIAYFIPCKEIPG